MTRVRLNIASTQALAGSWQVVGGGGSAPTVLSDDLDTTFIRAQGTAPQIAIRVPLGQIPAGSILKDITIVPRYRLNKAIGNNTDYHNWQFVLRSALSPNAAYVTTLIYIPQGVPADFIYGAPATAQVFASSADHIPQNEWGGLEVLARQVGQSTADPSTTSFDILDLDVLATYVTVPVVTVQAPSGTYTQTSRPASQWTHAPGSDGGEQVAYEAAWFTPSQWGVANFNPAVSPATQRASGRSADNAVRPPEPLGNGQWRMYVRTAQRVNNQDHWSAWVASSTFTVNVTPPTLSSVTVTSSNTSYSTTVNIVRTSGTPAWDFVDVQRLHPGTTEWVPVRGGTNATPVDADTLSLTDYETANGEMVRYRARAGRQTQDGTIVSPWRNADEDIGWSSSLTVLKDLYDPSFSMTLRVVLFPDDQRPRRQGMFQPLDGEYPVVVTGKRASRRGTITFLTETEDERERLDRLSERPVVLIQTPPGRGWGSRYVVLGDTLAARSSRIAMNETRRWPTPFVEVRTPADNFTVIVGAGVPQPSTVNPSTGNPSSFNPSSNPSSFNPSSFNPSSFNPSSFNPSSFNPSSDPGSFSSILVPSDGVLLGAATLSIDGTFNYSVGLQEYEQVSGGWATAIQHKYLTGNANFFSTGDRALLQRSGQPRSIMYYNWKVGGTWAQIASGASDATIRSCATRMKAWPFKFFLGMHHEPDNDVGAAGSGMTVDDFVDMWRHVHDVLDEEGVTNAVYVYTVTGYSSNRDNQVNMYPGAAYVDWVSGNPYGHAYATNVDLFMNERQAGGTGWYNRLTAMAPGKPVMLSEWGFGGDCAAANTILAALPAALESTYPMVKALVFWHDCNRPNNEVKQLAWSAGTVPTAGTFTVSFDGSTSATISRTATAAQVQTILRNMASIGSPNVVCTGGPLPAPIDIEFRGYLRGQNVPNMTVNGGGLSGGTAVMTANTTVPGDPQGAHVYYPQIHPYDAVRPADHDDAWATFAQNDVFNRVPMNLAP